MDGCKTCTSAIECTACDSGYFETENADPNADTCTGKNFLNLFYFFNLHILLILKKKMFLQLSFKFFNNHIL